jgi:hypothetical protein
MLSFEKRILIKKEIDEMVMKLVSKGCAVSLYEKTNLDFVDMDLRIFAPNPFTQRRVELSYSRLFAEAEEVQEFYAWFLKTRPYLHPDYQREVS